MTTDATKRTWATPTLTSLDLAHTLGGEIRSEVENEYVRLDDTFSPTLPSV